MSIHVDGVEVCLRIYTLVFADGATSAYSSSAEEGKAKL